jgi:glycosyltransferase involved in cell wall biosynthesis
MIVCYSVKQFAPPDTEIIVVADGDTEGSRNLAQEFTTKIITNEHPLGLGCSPILIWAEAPTTNLFFN